MSRLQRRVVLQKKSSGGQPFILFDFRRQRETDFQGKEEEKKKLLTFYLILVEIVSMAVRLGATRNANEKPDAQANNRRWPSNEKRRQRPIKAEFRIVRLS